MIIDDNGDTVIDNTLNTLGPVDACAAVSTSGSITFDVFLDSIPSGENLSGYNYVIQPLPAQNLNGLGVSAVVNVGNGAASIILGNEGSGTAFSLGTSAPNPLAVFGIQDADLGTPESGWASRCPSSPTGHGV